MEIAGRLRRLNSLTLSKVVSGFSSTTSCPCHGYLEKQGSLLSLPTKKWQIEDNYKQELISNEKKKHLSQNVWMEVTEDIAEKPGTSGYYSLSVLFLLPVSRASKTNQTTFRYGLMDDLRSH